VRKRRKKMSVGGIQLTIPRHPTTPTGWSEDLKRVTEEEDIFLFDEHDQELGTTNNTSSSHHLNHLEGLVQDTQGISIHNNKTGKTFTFKLSLMT
jgi:hypothetical protein